MAIRFKINANDLKSAINNKLTVPIKSITQDRKILDEINLKAIKIIEPYVPYKSGKLNNSVHLSHHARATEIVYSAKRKGYDYAVTQHNTIFRHRTRKPHTKAKSFWTNVVMPGTGYDGYERLVNYARKLIVKEVRKRQ